MNKKRTWFRIIIYIMILSMFLSTILFSLSWLIR